MNTFLVVDQYNEVRIEDCEAVVDHAVVNGLPSRFFKIEVDEDGSPELIEVTEVSK